MCNKVLSIEIGQQITKICEIDYKKKNPKVYHCISIEMPKDVIEDGYIRDKEAYAELLREALTKASIKNDKVVFTVSSTRIANREAIIPFVKDARIQDVVMANATDYFPIDVSDYNITYTILERVNTQEAKQIRLLVLAAPSNLIRTYYELADFMNFNIVAIDYIGNSTYQLLKNQITTGVNLIVQMNDQNTIVNLLDEDNLLIQRILPYGVMAAAEVMMENSIFDVNSYEQAVSKLSQQSILLKQFPEERYFGSYIDHVEPEQMQTMRYERAREEVTTSFKNLIGNVERIINYFTTKYPEKKITTIHLTGDGIQIQGVAELFHNEMGIAVNELKTLNNVTFIKDTAQVNGRQSSFISCIGATLRPIDFIPKEYAEKQKNKDTMLVPLICLGACIAVSIAIWGSSYFLYRNAIVQKNLLEMEIASILDIETIYSEYQQSKSNLENLEALDGKTKTNTEEFLTLLGEIERCTPQGTVVVSFNLTGENIVLNVNSGSKVECAKYIQELKGIERLNVVSVDSLSESESEAGEVDVTYTIVCRFK